jgi:hypothetical protein
MIVSYHSIARTAFTVRLALLNSNTPDKKMRLPQRIISGGFAASLTCPLFGAFAD